jgi:hypothetical protein
VIAVWKRKHFHFGVYALGKLAKESLPQDATVWLSHTAKPAAQLPSRGWVLLWKVAPSHV